MNPRFRQAAGRFARAHGAWLALALVLGAWFARPLWVAPLLPLDDLPNHLARITAYHYLDDPRWHLSPYYERSLGLVPYLGHFYPVHLLTYIFRTVTRANLVYMTLYIVTAPLCGWSYARATGRSPWLALLLLPLAVGYFFQWGFISFCVGALLVLPACALLYRLLDDEGRGWKRAAGLGLLTCVLYLCHILPWGAFGGYAALLLLIELGNGRWRGPLAAAASMAPSLLLMAIGWQRAHSVGYFHSGQKYEAVDDGPWTLMRRIALMFNLFQKQNVDEWIQLGIILLIVLLMVSDRGPEAEPWRKRARIPLAFVAFLLMAGLTPFWIMKPFNWWMINLRFLMLAAAVGIFLPRGSIRGARAVMLGFGVAASMLLPLYMARNYRDFSSRAEPIVQLIKQTPFGSNTLVLHTPVNSLGGRSFADPVMAPEMALWRELYNYPLVLRGGFDPYMYDDGFPIHRIASLEYPKVESALVKIFSAEETKFKPERMVFGWDYFIVKDDYLEAMPPDGMIKVDTIGHWSLFHNLLKDQKPNGPPPPAPFAPKPAPNAAPDKEP